MEKIAALISDCLIDTLKGGDIPHRRAILLIDALIAERALSDRLRGALDQSILKLAEVLEKLDKAYPDVSMMWGYSKDHYIKEATRQALGDTHD